MAIFTGKITSIKTKHSQRDGSAYLGIMAKSEDGTKVWFAQPMAMEQALLGAKAAATITVEYATSEAGTGLHFLKRPEVRDIDGWPVEGVPKTQKDQPETVDLGDFTGVVGLLKMAADKLKHPKLKFSVNGRAYKVYVAGPNAKRPGTVNVCDDAPYGQGNWYGRITDQGRFERSRQQMDDGVAAFLRSLAHDPAGVAAEYGHASGHCCFCGLELTDERSTSVGYGPVCAGNYGLPWGSKE